MKSQLINLKGGAKLLFNRQTEINGIHIEFCFRAGALNDPIGKLGVAHFCEHALYSFTDAKREKKDKISFARKFQYSNAMTSNEWMKFVISVVESDFEEAIDFVTEGLSSIKFLKEDFEEEQKIINDEIKMQPQINNRIMPVLINTKNINDRAHNNLIGFPAGTVETFSKITIDDLKDFVNKYITLNNLIITICGNITKSKAIKIIKKYVESRLKTSGVEGYDCKNLDLFEPSVNYAKAIEKGKSTISLCYDLEPSPYTYEFTKEESVTAVLRCILNEKAFEFFRTKYNLCYGCGDYIEQDSGHLINKLWIDCQEENIKEVISRMGEFIETFSGELPRNLFDKHKKSICDSYNFDLPGSIHFISRRMLNTYFNRHRMYNDKYKKEWNDLLTSVTYEETNEMYKKLFTVKPHINLIASEKFEKFGYDDIVCMKI